MTINLSPHSAERPGRLLAGAIGFYEATRCLYNDTEGFHFPALVVNLSFCAELSVKAFIAQKNPSANDRFLQKNIGHDLNTGLRLAEENGYYPPNSVTRELFDLLSGPHKNHEARYLSGEYIDLKPINLMILAMAHHLTEIARQMGTPITLLSLKSE